MAFRNRLFTAVTLLAAASAASAQITLQANPPPANNGGSSGWAIFMDLLATSGDLVVTEMETANTGAAGAAFTVEVFVYNGSGLGTSVSSGPGSSPSGWTSLGVANATQGPSGSTGISLPIDIPDIPLTQGQVTGVAFLFTGAGPRYLGTGTGAYSVFADSNLTLTTGDSRSAPFTATGSYFSPRALVGSLTYDFSSSGPTTYCTAGTSTYGCNATMLASGNPSLTQAAACSLTISAMEGQKSGIVFYGLSALPQPWCITGGGSSFLCVKAPTQRTITSNSGGTLNACDGSITLDWDAFQLANPVAVGNPWSVGDKVYVQGWYRDPPACKTTSMSDAIELTYLP